MTSPTPSDHPDLAELKRVAEADGFQVHVLKTWPGPFAAVRARKKTLEIRRNDRDFREGDTLWLEEFDPETQTSSGEVEVRVVTHVLPGGQFGIEPEFAALSISDAPLHSTPSYSSLLLRVEAAERERAEDHQVLLDADDAFQTMRDRAETAEQSEAELEQACKDLDIRIEDAEATITRLQADLARAREALGNIRDNSNGWQRDTAHDALTSLSEKGGR